MEISWLKFINLKQKIDIFKKLFKFSLHSKNTVITRYLHAKNNMYCTSLQNTKLNNPFS